MLKEDPRYDYAETESEQSVAVARMYSRPVASKRARSTMTLPVGKPMITHHASLPMQDYLQQRFAHIGGLDYQQRLLRAENQRRHDHCASLGHWPMSRTS